jgi:YjbE family integral membrane protein
MEFGFDLAPFYAFLQVVLIDLVLAGDNAVVIGLAAAGLPREKRGKIIFWGILAATVMRIGFALITVQLLQIIGLLFAGGLLLLWVCWKMWQELKHSSDGQEALLDEDLNRDGAIGGARQTKTAGQAIIQIMLADISMSLDNVLAVAGAAHEHPVILGFGLMLSVALMGIAATYIARLLDRHRWIAYIGLAIILFVALRMIFDGGHEVFEAAGHAFLNQPGQTHFTS